MFAIVMAGGAGTRLWPLSRRETPKQLLPLTGDTSLLQQTIARLGAVLKPHDIYVITSQAHVRPTQRQLPQLPENNILGEPLARSTAVAAALATVMASRDSDEVTIVVPADHFVSDEGAFADGLRDAV
ncbi:MAG: sugar phosphate nucleotidyltransferase, partial [Candidatus Limnocylindria bacterium]